MCVLDKCGNGTQSPTCQRSKEQGHPTDSRPEELRSRPWVGSMSREADKLPWHQAWLKAKQHVHNTHRVS